MTSILDGFNTVQQALAAHQFALSVTQRNVANANNASYTRQDIVYTADETEWSRSGVQGITVQAVRQRFIDHSISQELQSLGESTVASDALEQIDALMNGSGEGLQQALSEFFNSFASLSSSPENLTLRQEVLASANALTTEFHRLYEGMQAVQTSEDRALTYAVEEANSITAEIAVLNDKIRTAQAAKTEDEFTLRDSRQALIEQLSSLVDVAYYETESGSMTVSTRQGALLVGEDSSYPLELTSSSTGAFQGVFLEGIEITDSLESGKIGGLIDMRDNKISGYLTALDDLAATVISRVNDQHALGSDLNGETGGDFFEPFTPLVAGSNAGAARGMTVLITDTAKIAAAGDGMGVGNNDNAKLLAAISDETLFASSTASQFYAKLVYQIGNDEAAAKETITTQNSVLVQLRNQRDSLAGVSLDEEAISIIKYQKAYQASARYANVLDSLSNELLQLLGG